MVTLSWPCTENWTLPAEDAEAAITALATQGQRLIIDTSTLDFMDCSSLSALLRVQRLARQGRG